MKDKALTTWIMLAILVVVSSFLYLYQLGKVPPSPDWDEAALGWNAYAILHTGRDEYGAFMPVVLRSFDDYKPALYSYLIIPFLFIFGLTLTAVRMPSVVFGVLAVVATFFLCEELFNNRKLSFLIALLLAISPWHMQFSRIGFEANVGLSLNIFGALFFIKGLKKKWLLIPSVAFFVASLYVYQSEKVFSPLLFFLLVGLYWKSLWGMSKKYLAFVVVIGALLTLPMALFLVTNIHAFARAEGVSVLSDTSFLQESAERIITDRANHDVIGLVLDNRRMYIVKDIVANYLSHFDLNWLFIRGDISRHHAPNMGILYLWELPFILIGIFSLLFSDFSKKTKMFIFGWMLLAPLPAAVTTGVPHAVRTLNFLPTYQIYTAFGLVAAYHFFKKKNMILRYLVFALVGIFILYNIAYYFDQYFVQQNYYNSEDWQYGYQQTIAFLTSHPQYTKVVVSNQAPLDQSYMFFLFYLKYDPALYQKETENVSGGFAEVHHYGKYEFRTINWNSEVKNPQTLYVGRPSDFPGAANIVDTVYYLNGQPAVEMVE